MCVEVSLINKILLNVSTALVTETLSLLFLADHWAYLSSLLLSYILTHSLIVFKFSVAFCKIFFLWRATDFKPIKEANESDINKFCVRQSVN